MKFADTGWKVRELQSRLHQLDLHSEVVSSRFDRETRAGVATFGPATMIVASTIISIWRLVQRRRAFWVPIDGMVAAGLMTGLGGAIAFIPIG